MNQISYQDGDATTFVDHSNNMNSDPVNISRKEKKKIKTPRIAADIQILGTSFISYNIEVMILKSPTRRLGARLGLGLAYSQSDTYPYSPLYQGRLTIPFNIMYISGKNGRYFEFGLGATKHVVLEETYMHTYLGFRYQPLQKRIVLRVNLLTEARNDIYRIRPTLSFGYTFK